MREIETVAKDFAAKASTKKLNANVRKFLQLPPNEMLIWIAENVTHSNVAIQPMNVPAVVRVFPVVNNTTHTEVRTVFVAKLPTKKETQSAGLRMLRGVLRREPVNGCGRLSFLVKRVEC
jgi:hypothetical protein